VLSPCAVKVVSVEPFQLSIVSALEKEQDLYEDKALDDGSTVFGKRVCV
jgi:hypothetical protein